MRRIKSRAAAGVAVAAVLSMVAACSSTAGSTDRSGEGAGDSDVELHMTMWTSNPQQIAAFQAIGDAFMKQQPAVTGVKFDSLTLDQLDTVLTTGIQAGTPPDLSWLPVESSAQYIQAGALADVAPALKAAEGYNFDDLIPRLQERWADGDKLYGVPFSTGPLVMYFNKDLYARAGVKSPAELIAAKNWTWDSFRQSSKELHDKLNLPGYVLNDFDFKNWTRLLPILFSYGASPWNDDATKCTATSPEFTQAIEMFHGMVFDDGSSPIPGQQADFWGGQAGATTAFLGSNVLLKDATFKFGIVPTPAGPAGDTQALGQASIVVLAAGKHKDLASQFLAFLTNQANAETLSQFYPPTRASLLDPKKIVGTSTILTEDLVKPIIDATKSTGTIFPVAADASGVAKALNGSLDQFIWTKDADINAGLAKVCDAVQPLLK